MGDNFYGKTLPHWIVTGGPVQSPALPEVLKEIPTLGEEKPTIAEVLESEAQPVETPPQEQSAEEEKKEEAVPPVRRSRKQVS
jgi:hypothetical protein